MSPTKRFKTTRTVLLDLLILAVALVMAAALAKALTGFDVMEAVR